MSREGSRREGSAGIEPCTLQLVLGPLIRQLLLTRATILSTEPHISITVVFTLERAVNLDTNMNCMFMGKDSELHTSASPREQEEMHVTLSSD